MSLIAVFVIFVCLPVGAAREFEDTHIEFRMTEGSFGLTSILLAGSRMRTEVGAESLIVESTSRTVVMLNHQRKTFSRITEANREAFFKAIAGMMAEFRKSFEVLSPAERAALLARQPELTPLIDGGATTVEPGGVSTVAGRTCTVHRITLNKVPSGEACVVTAESLSLPEKDAASFKAALAVLSGFTTQLQKLLPPAPSNASVLSESSVPLRQTTIALGVRHTSEFVGVSHGAISMDVFSIPAGYTEATPGG